jgi:hypothetical protein
MNPNDRLRAIKKLLEISSEFDNLTRDIDYTIQNMYMQGIIDYRISYAEYYAYTNRQKIIALKSFKERTFTDLKQAKAIFDESVRCNNRNLCDMRIQEILECPQNFLSGAIDKE